MATDYAQLARPVLFALRTGPLTPVELTARLSGDWRNGLAWAEGEGLVTSRRAEDGGWHWLLTDLGRSFVEAA